MQLILFGSWQHKLSTIHSSRQPISSTIARIKEAMVVAEQDKEEMTEIEFDVGGLLSFDSLEKFLGESQKMCSCSASLLSPLLLLIDAIGKKDFAKY